MAPETFIKMIGPTCGKICAVYNLPASVCIAQAAIESGWGEAVIGNYNYFGRKWNGWGSYETCQTTEYINGEYCTIYDKFQSYTSLKDAIEDWCKLMRTEPLYHKAVAKWDENFYLSDFVEEMAKVYATDPNYAKKVLSTIKANNLTEYDAWGV